MDFYVILHSGDIGSVYCYTQCKLLQVSAPAKCLKYKCHPLWFNVLWVTEVDPAALALCLFLPHSQCPALTAAAAAAEVAG